MAFSKWQEQTPVQAPSEVELPPKEVMVSPADQGQTPTASGPSGGGGGRDAWTRLSGCILSLLSSHLPVRMTSQTSEANQPFISDPQLCPGAGKYPEVLPVFCTLFFPMAGMR